MKNSIYRHEYFFNNQWHEYDPDEVRLQHRPDSLNVTLVSRMKRNFTRANGISDVAEEHWYLGPNRHRLDGPAHWEIWPVRRDWWIHGRYLDGFGLYVDCADNTDKIFITTNILFKYINSFPQYLEQVILIGKHHNLLTDENIFLMKTLATFQS